MPNLFIAPHISSIRDAIGNALGESILMVCDANTYDALGKRIASEYAASALKILQLDKPKASLQTVSAITQKLDNVTGVLAVGSGTLNDVCKYAAFQKNIPYAIAATAPSMNGFVSPTASLIPSPVYGGGLGRGNAAHVDSPLLASPRKREEEQIKQSYSAAPPVAVLADLEVLAASPVRLIRSGLGDSLARPTAQIDWWMAHLVMGTPYDTKPFALVSKYEYALFEQSAELSKGNLEIIELLFRTLIASGEGMRISGSSAPASQGEHMIAHTMEMQNKTLPETYHGEQISVTTLTMAERQERVLQSGAPPTLKPCNASWPKCEPAMRVRIEAALAEGWEYIREQLQSVQLPASYLRDVARAAGCPLTPYDLGWKEADYKIAVDLAHTTRDRFTFLDFN